MRASIICKILGFSASLFAVAMFIWPEHMEFSEKTIQISIWALAGVYLSAFGELLKSKGNPK